MSLPHEQDPHAGTHVAHQLAASSSSSSAPPPTASTSSHTVAPNLAAAAVRLPSVSLPSADLFANSAFAGGRRQSINSDPFLHAFSAAHDVGIGHPRPGDPYRLTPAAGSSHAHDGLSLPNVHPQPGPSAPVPNGVDGNANGLNERWHPGLESGFPGYPSTSGTTQHNGLYASPGEHPFAPSSSAGPLSSYRFGGPSQASLGSSAPAGAAPMDAPSFVDYSMRRASLSRSANEPVSPRRTPSGRASPTSGVKRKALDEGDAGRGQSPYLGGPGQHAGGLPDSKRQTSALGGSDKLGQSAPLNGQQDMGLPAPHVAPWEEQRRDSGGSYGSSGGHSYSMTSYAPPHSMPSSSSTTYGSRPPSAPAPNQPVPAGSPWEARPQQTHYNPLEQTAGAAMFPRRPSIPSVSQMMQGLPSGFVGGSNAQPAGPPGSVPPFAAGAARPGQPSLTVSSVPATPSEREQLRQSRSASNPAFQSAETAPPPSHAKSRPDWQTHSQPSTRQNSSGSIHLDPLSLPGGLMNKDSPYSRSPELRVSHKLAERKRRKEMTQLFEDLRDSLPFDRGLKASKWEILSKAIEYVAQLKSYTAELAEDNRNLRQHYGLPPGPAMAVHDGPIDGGSGGVAGSSHQYDDRPLQQSRGASPHVGLPMGVANAAPTAPSQQLQWHEQNLLDPDAMQDRKPNPAHFAKQTGHSPVIPSRLHSQFGTSSQHSTPQPSPTLPPSSTTGSGRNTPAAVGTGSPHPLERSMTGPPVSAA